MVQTLRDRPVVQKGGTNVPAMSYLFRHPKTSVYWFRRAVPAGLRPIVGRTEVKRSLGTTDVREAKCLALTVAAEVHELFTAAGRTASEAVAAGPAVNLGPDGVEVALGSSAPGSVMHRPACLPEGYVPAGGYPSEDDCSPVRIAPALIDAAVVACCRSQVERWRQDDAEPWRVGPTPIEDAIESQRHSLAVWHFAAAHRDWSIASSLIDEALKVTGRRRSDASRGDIAALARALTFGVIRLTEYRIAELEARLPQAPGPPAPAIAITRDATSPAMQPDVTLMELLELYDRERRYEKRLKQEITTILRRFGEVSGPELPVRRLSVKHASDYKAARLSMPFKLSRAERKLTLPQIVAAAGDDDAAEKVSPTTVAKDLNLLRGLAAWGVREGYLTTNPFEGISVRVSEGDKLQRDSFTEEDLAMLVGSPLYRGCRSAMDRSTAGPLIIKDADYWLPLLGLYHGARLEELGQMLVSDVRFESVPFTDGRVEEFAVLYIDTRDERQQSGPRRRRGREEAEPFKRIKTRSSKRCVPVHPMLLRLGFLDYVAAAKAAGHARIHHMLKVDGYGRTTKIWSQWFGRYLTSIGLSRPELTFHSTRHTFKTACRRARIPRDVSHALSGHSSSDVGDRYGEYPLEVLAGEIARVSYPAIEKALGLT
jgi:integrase